MSDDWTRKRRKEKFDKRKSPKDRDKFGEPHPSSKQERRRPRKKNWSIEEFLDGSTEDSEDSGYGR